MKRNMFRVLSLAAVIFMGYGQSNIARSAEDIVGLTIGMTPEEVRLVLPKINPKFKIRESRDQGWNALVIEAEEPLEKLVLKFTESNPKAWFIGRTVAIPQGKRPTRADVSKELIAKYGKPSISNVGNSWGDYFAWGWASNKHQESDTLHACAMGPVQRGSWDIAGGAPIYQRSVSRDCLKLIEATSGTAWQENPNVAGAVGVTILDQAMAFSDPKHPTNAAAIREKQQIEEAGKNKPRL